jgi:hypothetical protein
MNLSDATQLMLGLTLVTVPTIQYGGYFLLTQLIRPTVIRNRQQAAFYRAGHAHAGVLVILSLIGHLLVEIAVSPSLHWPVRIGLFLAPILISAGFFGAAPREEGGRPGRLIVLIYAGAFILIADMLVLGLGLIFG